MRAGESAPGYHGAGIRGEPASSSATESVADMVNQVVIVDENNKVLQTLKNAADIQRYGLAQAMLKQTAEDLTAQAKTDAGKSMAGRSRRLRCRILGIRIISQETPWF